MNIAYALRMHKSSVKMQWPDRVLIHISWAISWVVTWRSSTVVLPCSSSWTTPWSVFCPWHHRKRHAESSTWFELLTNISTQCVRSSCAKTKIRRALTTHMYSRRNNPKLTRPTGAEVFTKIRVAYIYIHWMERNLLLFFLFSMIFNKYFVPTTISVLWIFYNAFFYNIFSLWLIHVTMYSLFQPFNVPIIHLD